MPRDGGPLYEVAWQEVFPWLRLFRAARLAADVRKLFLAVLGILLTALGWSLLEAMFAPAGAAEGVGAPAIETPWQQAPLLPPPFGHSVFNAALGNAVWFASPLVRLVYGPWSLASTTHAVLAFLWGLAVWAFVGLAIARMAAVEFAREERIALKTALRFARWKWRSCFTAPLMPIGTVLVMAAPLYLLGLFMDWLGVGWLVAGVLWPLVLVVGVLMAILLAGLILGWPLMWSTLAVEAGDSFDGLHGPYSYVLQRPLQYVFYVVVSAALGLAAWLVAAAFGGLVLWSVDWATGIGYGVQVPRGGVGGFGVALVNFWRAAVPLVVLAYAVSYFWTAWTGIYFQLRRDTDATDLDEIYFEQADEVHGLPPLTPDAAGVPTLAESERHDSAVE